MNSKLQAVYDSAVAHEHEQMNNPHNVATLVAGVGLAVFWIAIFWIGGA